jgi:hypothetical protein
MKYLIFPILVFSVFLSVSCKNDTSGEVKKETQAPASNNTDAALKTDAAINASSNPNTTTSNTTIQPVTTQPIQPVATGKGLNPEHGKPGHRCDIPVGAPLDSKPAAAPTINTSPVISTAPATQPNPVTPVTIQPNPIPSSGGGVAAGMNPEHGKPGHRCDIPVGAPLNSKPAAKQ